jgi:glutathione S-transferase
MDQLMGVNDWYLFLGVGNIIGFQRIVGPRLMGLTPDEAVIAEAMPRARVVINELARQLGDGPYFTGDSLSLADLLLTPQLEFMSQTPEWAELGAQHENLVTWLARMEARPSLQATTWERVARMAQAA